MNNENKKAVAEETQPETRKRFITPCRGCGEAHPIGVGCRTVAPSPAGEPDSTHVHPMALRECIEAEEPQVSSSVEIEDGYKLVSDGVWIRTEEWGFRMICRTKGKQS